MNELYHYGVIGMRWGHHKARYDNRAQRHVAKIGTSHTRLAKNFHNQRAAVNEYKSNVAKSLSKDRGKFAKQYGNLYGHGDLASRQKANANYYDRKASYTHTKLGTAIAKRNAFNNASYAKSNATTHKSKSGREYLKNFGAGVFKTPVKTFSGRKLSSGAKYVEDMFMPMKAIGVAYDVNQYVRTSKSQYKKAKSF